MRGMEMEISQRAQLRIGPAQLLLAELVTLPVAGLTVRLDAELDANPALDLPDPPSCGRCGLPLWRGSCAPCRHGLLAEQDHQAVLGWLPARPNARLRMLSDAAASLAPGDRWIAEYLLADVDDHGLLAEPLAVVAVRLGCPAARVQRVVNGLRKAGAPGLCARTLGERIALQVAAAEGPVPQEVHQLLQGGIQALAIDERAAARAGSLTMQQLASALAWLRTHIAADVVERDEAPRTPAPVDVIVRRVSTGLLAETVAGPWSAVRVAPSYLAHAGDAGLRREVTRAARFVEALARRETVLTRVCDVVLHRQATRILNGPKAHVPLSRRDVAAELGVHESTISRVVAQKHLLLPSGEVVTLAALFGGDDTLRQCLRELVAGESVPQSDTELARALAGRGHMIARRTIAKYRAEMGIPHQRHRRGGQHDADQQQPARHR